jgi:hypothetical protein
MVKHRAFNWDRFLDKFQGQEAILVAYTKSWGPGLDVGAAGIDIAEFKQFLLTGTGSSKNEFVEGLYRAYDLATDQGYEDLIAACRDLNYCPDPSGRLPMECLSLKVRTENEAAFNLAYDRCAPQKAERFTVFPGQPGPVNDDAATTTERLQERFRPVHSRQLLDSTKEFVVTEPISKSGLSAPHRRLIETMQRLNFGRIENLPIRDGAPVFGPGARFIQKVKIGGDSGPRPEAVFNDFLLKKQTIELVETLTDLGDGMVLTIEVKHGLPFALEIELGNPSEVAECLS